MGGHIFLGGKINVRGELIYLSSWKGGLKNEGKASKGRDYLYTC